MPERSRIFWVDDDIDFRKSWIGIVEGEGHTIVDTADTLGEAIDKIPGLEKKGVNLAIVDGNLEDGFIKMGADGEKIAEEIKKQHPNIIVIGNAGATELKHADYNSTKIVGPEKLLETIKNA
jgi:DNA-binding NtrC family response regulator